MYVPRIHFYAYLSISMDHEMHILRDNPLVDVMRSKKKSHGCSLQCFVSCSLVPPTLFPRKSQQSVDFRWHGKRVSFRLPRKQQLVVVVGCNNQPIARVDSVSNIWTTLQQSVVVFDFAQYSCFKISGNDRLSFLHNMTSNHFLDLKPFQVRWTVFLNSTGRIVDVALVIALQDSLLVVASIEKKQTLWEHLDRHIFPMDNVYVTEENYSSFVWIGKDVDTWIAEWCHSFGLSWNKEQQVQVFLQGTSSPMYLLHQSTLEPAWNGYLVLCSPQETPQVQTNMKNFENKGFHLFRGNKEHWDLLRIAIGKGNVLREWSEQYHPLEAGLWHMISFQKGCYLGQETILRLKTYGGVKRYLVGWYLERPVEPFSYVYCQGKRVGNITSCIELEHQIVVGLGYLHKDYVTNEYICNEPPLEQVLARSSSSTTTSPEAPLPWLSSFSSTPFYSQGSSSCVVQCIARTISFPVWHQD